MKNFLINLAEQRIMYRNKEVCFEFLLDLFKKKKLDLNKVKVKNMENVYNKHRNKILKELIFKFFLKLVY